MTLQGLVVINNFMSSFRQEVVYRSVTYPLMPIYLLLHTRMQQNLLIPFYRASMQPLTYLYGTVIIFL